MVEEQRRRYEFLYLEVKVLRPKFSLSLHVGKGYKTADDRATAGCLSVDHWVCGRV